MNEFPLHTVNTAPEASREALEGLQTELRMIPNLAASMAESPELLIGFLALRRLMERGSFRPGQVQVLALANAFENACEYCMALHSTVALSVGVPRDAVAALREGRDPADPQLGALSRFSRALVRARGKVPAEELNALLAAGFKRRHALEIVLQIATSIMPNFAHHLTGCPIDEVFQPERWYPHEAARSPA